MVRRALFIGWILAAVTLPNGCKERRRSAGEQEVFSVRPVGVLPTSTPGVRMG